VMEYISGGSLEKVLLERQLTQPVLLYIAEGVAKGLSHLHGEGVVHRNLASRNVLLQPVQDSFIPKITDFAMSKFFVTEDSTGSVKSLKWLAPESISQKLFSLKSDIWSFGCVLTEIFNRGSLYPDEDALQVCVAVSTGKKKPMSTVVNGPLKSLIDSCFAFEANDRPTIDRILSSFQQLKS